MSEIAEGATHYGRDNGYRYRCITDHSCDYWSKDEGCWISALRAPLSNDLVEIFYVGKKPDVPTPTPRIAAHEFLERGVKHMRDRAVQRDSDAGERSMARAVAAFNAQEGTNLTEAQGWRFMIQLKYARAVNGVFVADDYEDMAAYAGLAGEAAQ